MAAPLMIDLNCDLGESFGRYTLGDDDAMMKLITSVNIACGFHAGDPGVMAQTVFLAKKHGVALGAHPGYPDLQGFGRRQMSLSHEEISNIIFYQLGALEAFARAAGLHLSHVKPHGALYNLAAQDATAARAVAQAVSDFDKSLIVVGLAGSELIAAGEWAGLQVAREGFPDRAYLADGQLIPRSQKGAVISDPEEVAKNALRLVREGVIISGKVIRIDTLCLHGDNPASVGNALAVRWVLEAEGVEICSLVGKRFEHDSGCGVPQH